MKSAKEYAELIDQMDFVGMTWSEADFRKMSEFVRGIQQEAFRAGAEAMQASCAERSTELVCGVDIKSGDSYRDGRRDARKKVESAPLPEMPTATEGE